MSNDGSDTPRPFDWGLAPRDPAVIAAEQEAAARAAEQQAAAIKAAEAARAARGGQPTAPFAGQFSQTEASPTVPPVTPAPVTPPAVTPPPASATPPVSPPLVLPPEPAVPPVYSWQVGANAVPPVTDENRQASPTQPPAEPEPRSWDVPTVATPFLDVPTEPHDVNPPPQTYPWEDHFPAEDPQETQAFTAQDLADAVSPNAAPSSGEPVPVEGAPTSAIDSLFSDTAFKEYEEESLLGQIPIAPRSTTTTTTTTEKLPHLPLTPTQRRLIWVAGGLIALLILVALFFFGRTLAQPEAAPPAETPAPVETPEPETPDVPALGPVAPGVYAYDELLGTECITPYTSPWEEEYTVVACDEPHLAQMVAVGAFDDAADEAYPGGEELDSRINQLCTSNEIIDYDAAGEFDDIQIAGSYPATAEAWDAGDRTYYCFVTRESGDTLTTSIANEPVAAETDAE